MCYKDNHRLVELYDSIKRVPPEPGCLEHDMSFYRGLLHGIKLSLQQVPVSESHRVQTKPKFEWVQRFFSRGEI